MREVKVVDYNSQWPAMFEAERDLLLNRLGQLIHRVHHIGSTSVPGLRAKPVIDIMLEVESLQSLDAHQSEFESLGYEGLGENGISRRRYFQKGGDDRTHQIHAFPIADEHVTRHLAFRDYLIAHPDVKLAYQELKQRVAAQCDNDIERYCDGKDSFIQEHEAKALLWYSQR
ncbi:GrpB family protein [Paraferrimonas sedimenticola]|uniref:GrpB family protein n=1 Tax=Paraferrimonas sedimenticola TaxID=375674 RepID=A0AA37RUW2_9GAMM|nr:GrpB family protein [Paraferrimonas sedimenticola]GLP95603.1 hypothetical protein GCM10007895_09090 [Paraferrimonas sedimenticola]